MKIFTIGFTKKSAEQFFSRLQAAGVRRLVDVRLNNVSQLAGFTKREDLKYFTKAICHIDYLHLPALAPTAEILDPYKKAKNGDWPLYERQFLELMKERRIAETVPRDIWMAAACFAARKNPITVIVAWWRSI